MTQNRAVLKLESTGDSSFDEILGGGIPAQSVVVIAGEPGSGKTVLSLQMLFRLAQAGKKCLYFTTLSEPSIKLVRYMQQFEFFDPALVGTRVGLADLGGVLRKGADAVLNELSTSIEKHQPAFVVIDSFRAITDILDSQNARTFIYDLANQTASWGATTLLVGEYGPVHFSDYAEFGIADGIFRLGTEKQELTSIREFEVLKLRGMNYVAGRHFLEIGGHGVLVYPRVRAPQPTDILRFPKRERISSGVKELDHLIRRGNSSR
jgi:circadian clock protein KaiC